MAICVMPVAAPAPCRVKNRLPVGVSPAHVVPAATGKCFLLYLYCIRRAYHRLYWQSTSALGYYAYFTPRHIKTASLIICDMELLVMTHTSTNHKHIVLTSHPGRFGAQPIPIQWGHAEPLQRGPVIATLTQIGQRNVIGTHAGSYAVYRALAVASGALQSTHRPDLTDTAPAEPLGPHASWGDAERIVSMDPFGAIVCQVFTDFYSKGYDIRPTIAITKAHINLPE